MVAIGIVLIACKKEKIVSHAVVIPVVYDTIPDGGSFRIRIAKDSINSDVDLIYFNHTKSVNYIPGEDAPSLSGFGIDNISVMEPYNVDKTKIVPESIVQMPYTVGMIIPLGVRAKIDTIYIIKALTTVKMPTSIKIWLKDSLTGDSTNIRAGNAYVHIAVSPQGVYVQNRFSLILR